MAKLPVAVVVGVGPGLGAALAHRFARGGYAVAMVARSADKLEVIAKEIADKGGQAICESADAADVGTIRSCFERIRGRLGHPEVLVYNTGPSGFGWPPPKVMEISIDRFRQALDVGVVGALACAQEVLPKMVEAQKGTILVTGATASLKGGAGFSVLACPKFALRALTQSIAREFGPQGIHVAHVIVDGQIYNEKTVAMMGGGRTKETFLDPACMADTYFFLHSQERTTWTHELELRPSTEKW